MIDTIIFDADGVILDSEKLWDKGQEEFLKRRGFKYERDKLKHLMTSTSPAEGVLVMQRGTKFYPGTNVMRGTDDTLFAVAEGYVHFEPKGRQHKQISVHPELKLPASK